MFEDLLVDHDPSVNSANWMWLSASAFFVQVSEIIIILYKLVD